MRAVERAVIGGGMVTGRSLMERAGAGVVQAVLSGWPGAGGAPRRACVLCGPGNNGGDGFVIARLLRAQGWTVEVGLMGDAAGLPPDSRANHAAWAEGGAVHPLEDMPTRIAAPGCALVVDALFGTGLTRPVAGLAGLRDASAASGARRVAVDLPSGLCADSGRVLAPAGAAADHALPADLTVTFHTPKPGHYLADGAALCGTLRVVEIGLPAGEAADDVLRRVGPPGGLGKAAPAHKYGHGHALVLSGGPAATGAARLSARGALRIGAGLVTLGVPLDALAEVAAQITAVMAAPVADAASLADRLSDPRLNAVCLGPGLGIERAHDLVPEALRSTTAHRGVILDADALSAHVAAPEGLFAMLDGRCVITPHGGEFARLFPDLARKLRDPATTGPAFSRVDAARIAAARAGCVVLLKGHDTIIAAPGGRCAVHAAVYEDAAPWLATAGSGDALAGYITGLVARGWPPFDAACAAAWLHAACAREFGPGLIAEDLPEMLPRVLRRLPA